MNTGSRISLSLMLALGMMIAPQFARAGNVDNTHQARPFSLAQSKREAAEMVPVAANLKTGIDARKVRAGDRIEATLQETVHLKNGPELKRGTVLLGRVTADRMQQGNARLALRFTRAQLKNGKTLPIKATVLMLTPPAYSSGQDLANQTGLWHGHTLQVDQIGALHDVDMHSRIAGMNSAVLVSRKKDDMKLKASSQMLLAIAERS